MSSLAVTLLGAIDRRADRNGGTGAGLNTPIDAKRRGGCGDSFSLGVRSALG